MLDGDAESSFEGVGLDGWSTSKLVAAYCKVLFEMGKDEPSLLQHATARGSWMAAVEHFELASSSKYPEKISRNRGL